MFVTAMAMLFCSSPAKGRGGHGPPGRKQGNAWGRTRGRAARGHGQLGERNEVAGLSSLVTGDSVVVARGTEPEGFGRRR